MDRETKQKIEKILFNGNYKKTINNPNLFMDEIIYRNIYPDIDTFSIDMNAKCILARSFAIYIIIKKDGKNIDGKSNDDINREILNSFIYNFLNFTKKRYTGNELTDSHIKNIDFKDKKLPLNLIKIACAYTIDGLIEYLENNLNQAWFYLSQANYYLGMMQGM